MDKQYLNTEVGMERFFMLVIYIFTFISKLQWYLTVVVRNKRQADRPLIYQITSTEYINQYIKALVHSQVQKPQSSVIFSPIPEHNSNAYWDNIILV
jgi:hypothetical protein